MRLMERVNALQAATVRLQVQQQTRRHAKLQEIAHTLHKTSRLEYSKAVWQVIFLYAKASMLVRMSLLVWLRVNVHTISWHRAVPRIRNCVKLLM
jgi:hypothetical protein